MTGSLILTLSAIAASLAPLLATGGTQDSAASGSGSAVIAGSEDERGSGLRRNRGPDSSAQEGESEPPTEPAPGSDSDAESNPGQDEEGELAPPEAPDELEPEAERDDVELGQMVVTANRARKDVLDVPAVATGIGEFELRTRLPQTTPDVLAGEVGVVVQKTNQGGGSPILRGRTGKSVLMVLDGMRFNNSTFRRNHQYLNTLELGDVERLEIVRGPSSVLYGSDAIGGVVHVITRRREPGDGGRFAGRFLGRMETANDGRTAFVGLEGDLGKTGFTAGLSARRLGHLRAGSGSDPVGAIDQSGRQVPTAYDGHAYSFSLQHPLTEVDTLDAYFFHERQEDVPRSDVLIGNRERPDPPDLRRDVDPQRLDWFQLRWRRETPGETLEGFTLATVVQRPQETRRRIRASAPDQMIVERDALWIPGLLTQAELRPHADHRVVIGGEASFERIDSERETVDLNGGGVVTDANGRFPDGARYDSMGLYVQDEWQMNEHVEWTAGVRYSRFQVDADFDGLTVGPLGPFGSIDETFDDVTFALGASVKWTETTRWFASVARGFRAPNLDDLAVLGDFASGERVPNFDLDPESVLQLETGLKHRSRRVQGGVALAVAFDRDVLDLEPIFEQNGTTFFQLQNRSRALIWSFEQWGQLTLRETDGESPEQFLFAQSFASFGRNTSDDEPLSKVPPPQGEIGWRMQSAEGTWLVDAYIRGAFRQHRLSRADEADPRIPSSGTPGWATLNLRGTSELKPGLFGTVALENVFDRRYRVHGSGIDAPGTNLVVQVDWRF